MNAPAKMTFSEQSIQRIKFVGLILIIIAVIGIGYRITQYIKLKFATEQQAILAVATIKADPGPLTQEIILPGNVQAWHETTIFARTNGYVVRWMVDIGAKVKEGDLLAEITAPEVDAQLRQTEADLITAEANYQLAKITANRWVILLKTQSVSKQETDEKVSDEKAKAAVVASTLAARDRLKSLVSFQRINAPFDGIIMSRTTDIGRLINAGSGPMPLFRLVQANRLRVYVRVPEYDAKYLTGVTQAKLYFTEHPGKCYVAKLLNTAKAIDPKSRTLLVQLEVNNDNYELLSGSYTQVHFTTATSATAVRLPVNTLIFRAHGLQIATVDPDNKIALKSITLGRDFGDYVEVVAGVKRGEIVVLNPPDSLIVGQKVKIVSSDQADKGKQST